MAVSLDREVQRFLKSYTVKKGQFWSVAVPNGRGDQIRQRGFHDKAAALKYAKAEYSKILFRADRATSSVCSGLTFAEYSRIWLDTKVRNDLRPATIRRYRDQVEDFLIPFFGGFKLVNLEKFHLRNYIHDSQDASMSTYNVNSTVTLFKMMMKQAVEDDYMPMTNIHTVRTPKHTPKEPRFWDEKQMGLFLNAVCRNVNFPIWKFVLFTGLRAGEIAALKWDCIHLNRKSGGHTGFIEVRRTCSQKNRVISETTKNGDRRLIPIFPQIKNLILDLKASAQGEFVFGGMKPLETSHLNRTLQTAVRKIDDLEVINFHGLRHTFCSYLDATGMPCRIVSEIMGHRDLNTTNRYSHVSNQTMGAEVLRWSNSQNQQRTSNILEVVS